MFQLIQKIRINLAATGINEEDVKKIWWNDGAEDIEMFWSKRFLKHYQFSAELDDHDGLRLQDL